MEIQPGAERRAGRKYAHADSDRFQLGQRRAGAHSDSGACGSGRPMKRRLLAGVFLLFALASGGAWWLQRMTTEALRDELAIERTQNRELARLQADNAQRRAAQPSPEELARLRADHAAVFGLRRELEELRAGIEARERALTRASAAPSSVSGTTESDRDAKLRVENEERKRTVEAALAAQQKRKQERAEKAAREQAPSAR
jgi:hypothetical protein